MSQFVGFPDFHGHLKICKPVAWRDVCYDVCATILPQLRPEHLENVHGKHKLLLTF